MVVSFFGNFVPIVERLWLRPALIRQSLTRRINKSLLARWVGVRIREMVLLGFRPALPALLADVEVGQPA
jgi:hypothetical protein